MTSNHIRQTVKRMSVGLLASLVLVAPFALSPATAQASCGRAAGFWTTIPGPKFPSGPAAMTSFVIDPAKPSQMFGSNGVVVMRSNDGGCSWDQVYEVGSDLPVAVSEQRIESIAVPETGGGRVLLMIEEQVGPQVRPRVVRTDDDGGSWETSDVGLPPVGDPVILRVAPSDPDVAYLAVGEGDVTELLFGSDDGGLTWTLRNNFARTMESGINDVAVDPLAPNDVWVGGSDGLYHSTDGGRSFTADPEMTGLPIGPIDVFHQEGGPASLMIFNRAESGGAVSGDGGQNWLTITAPGFPSSVAHGNDPYSRAVSSIERVWLFVPNIFAFVDARAPSPDTGGLMGDRTSSGALYGFTASTVEIYRGPEGVDIKVPRGNEVAPDVSLLDPGVPPKPQPAKLTPDGRVIKIDAGDSKTVPFDLRLPKSKTPLDVYFVIDTSSSQKKFIVGMADALEGIINGLVRSGTDVRFGLAEYRNYPDSDPPRLGPPGSGSQFYEPNFLYRQLSDLTHETAGIEEALRNIEADGGGHYNAQLEALYQTATGAGADAQPPGPAGNDVPPGLQAEFRREAINVAVLVSDEEFIDQPLPADSDPTPPDLRKFEEAASALKAKGIKQVGLSLAYAGEAPATADMVEMARETGALAPAGGVDCDGDGSADLAGGDALVCEIDRQSLGEETALAKAIVNLVESIRTRGSVGLKVRAREDIVQKVAPESYESLVISASDSLTFDATFRCPLGLAGERFPVQVAATGLLDPARADATVVCRSVADSKEEEDLLQFPLDRVLGLIPLVPVSPPPPLTELATSTQAQAQSQAQAQAQAAMAAQEQEQPQLAFVHAMHAMQRQQQEEYAMSSFQAPPTMPAHGLALAGATLVMSLGFGAAMARQRVRLRLSRRRVR